MSAELIIREATVDDVPSIARINAEAFLGHRGDQQMAAEWIASQLRAAPRVLMFVGEVEGKVVGYITWEMHGGFRRPEPVVELEQLAVDEAYRGRDFGDALVSESVQKVVAAIRRMNDRVESSVTAVVWSYVLNQNAMRVYARWFGETKGFRTQYGDRSEVMFARRIPVVGTNGH